MGCGPSRFVIWNGQVSSGPAQRRCTSAGKPSVHPLRGDEIRALRGLRRQFTTIALFDVDVLILFMRMNKVTVGWTVEIVGTALWLLGYFRPGTACLVDWKNITPWWIAEWLPSLQAEVGMALTLIGMTLIYWPARARK